MSLFPLRITQPVLCINFYWNCTLHHILRGTELKGTLCPVHNEFKEVTVNPSEGPVSWQKKLCSPTSKQNGGKI